VSNEKNDPSPRLGATGPNADQIDYWNTEAGAKWVSLQQRLDTQLEMLGQIPLDALALRAGERVLDVGCGCGTTTMELARAVGDDGTAVGADISAVMLERARQVARERAVANVRFENVDAQSHQFDAAFDAVYSRFGVMFFADPRAAFANLRAALAPGGRLAFVCWRGVIDNAWMAVPVAAALEHITIELPTDPHAPGPFAFADPDHVTGILDHAGFENIEHHPVDIELAVGGDGDIDEAVAFLMQIGPTARVLREADEATRATVTGAVRKCLEPYATGDGVRMDSGSWLFIAR